MKDLTFTFHEGPIHDEGTENEVRTYTHPLMSDDLIYVRPWEDRKAVTKETVMANLQGPLTGICPPLAGVLQTTLDDVNIVVEFR